MNVVVAIAQNLMIIVFESNSISHHSLSSFYLAFFRTYWHSWKSLHIIEKNNYLASQSEVALMWDIRLFVDKGTSTIVYELHNWVRKISEIDTKIWTFLIQSGRVITLCLNPNIFAKNIDRSSVPLLASRA